MTKKPSLGMGMSAQRIRDTGILPYHLAWNEAERLNQTTTYLCDCGEFGPVTDCVYLARAEWRAHQAAAHPERKSSRKVRKRPGFSMSQKTLEQNLAESRKSGATSWEGAAA